MGKQERLSMKTIRKPQLEKQFRKTEDLNLVLNKKQSDRKIKKMVFNITAADEKRCGLLVTCRAEHSDQYEKNKNAGLSHKK